MLKHVGPQTVVLLWKYNQFLYRNGFSETYHGQGQSIVLAVRLD